jgi:hypothetical protein
MPAVLIDMTEADKAALAQAAEAAGLSQREFARRAIRDACAGVSLDLAGMVREIHKAVTAKPKAEPEPDDAVAVLTGLGLDPKTAAKRVQRVKTDNPSADTATVIREALRKTA